MPAHSPHYLLFSEGSRSTNRRDAERCSWRFVLESIDGHERVVAEDDEPEAAASRAELLAVVRGLEALDGPSRVTLVTRSQYVARGIRRGLSEWRRHNWRWERFGRWVPVRDHDLWQRVDRALRFHRVDCRVWRFDQQHSTAETNLDSNRSKRCATSDLHSSETSCVPAPKANFRRPARHHQNLPKAESRSHSVDYPETVYDWCRTAFGKMTQLIGWESQNLAAT